MTSAGLYWLCGHLYPGQVDRFHIGGFYFLCAGRAGGRPNCRFHSCGSHTCGAVPVLFSGRSMDGIKRHDEVFGRVDIAFVDARKKGSLQIPYSFIEPIPEESIAKLRSYETVIVYCNTRDAHKSKMMAGELSSAGVEGAVYLQGGFYEWVKSGGEYIGTAPEAYEGIME